MRMAVGIGSGLVILNILFLFLNLFIPVKWLTIFLCVTITSIVYFMLIFPYVTIIVPENEGWVMANRFVSESAEPTDTFSGYRTIRAQKEFQAGFHWKYPQEELAKEGAINMKRIIKVEHKQGESYTLNDGSTIELKYLIPVVPLPGRIVNLYRMKEEDIIRKIKTRAEAFFQGYFGEKDAVTFGVHQQEELKNAFENLFGGPNTIDPEELEMGIWTGTPEVYDIGNIKAVEDARNFERAMGSVFNVAKKMVKKSGGQMSWDQGIKLALLGKGQAKIDFVELSGIFGSKPAKKKGQTP